MLRGRITSQRQTLKGGAHKSKLKTKSDCLILSAVPTFHVDKKKANTSYHHVKLASFLFDVLIEFELVTIV